ncbi:MAG: KOW domain-containing RNA-binding protein [Acidaminobacteraceae bacterium]
MVTTKDFQVGQFIRSKAGRDKDRIFIIIDKIDENYLLLVDGDLRKVESPKRKKIKHIASVDLASDDIKTKLLDGKKVTNLMIRREIEKLGLM